MVIASIFKASFLDCGGQFQCCSLFGFIVFLKCTKVPVLGKLSQVLIDPSEFSFRILEINLAHVASGFHRSQTNP